MNNNIYRLAQKYAKLAILIAKLAILIAKLAQVILELLSMTSNYLYSPFQLCLHVKNGTPSSK